MSRNLDVRIVSRTKRERTVALFTEEVYLSGWASPYSIFWRRISVYFHINRVARTRRVSLWTRYKQEQMWCLKYFARYYVRNLRNASPICISDLYIYIYFFFYFIKYFNQKLVFMEVGGSQWDSQLPFIIMLAVRSRHCNNPSEYFFKVRTNLDCLV